MQYPKIPYVRVNSHHETHYMPKSKEDKLSSKYLTASK